MEQLKQLATTYNKLIRLISLGGGRFVFVGGAVRDALLGRAIQDADAEVFGLNSDKLKHILNTFDEAVEVGKSFGVFKLKNYPLDVSLPRRDSKIGVGHKGFHVHVTPDLTFKEAASRRDLTINSMGYDPLTDEILDPYEGQKDLAKRILRATDPVHFGEDPLRALRVAQFAARFEMVPEARLRSLCQRQDLTELPAERIVGELKKLFTKGGKPSLGLTFLKDLGLLDQIMPEFEDLSLVDWGQLLSVVDRGSVLVREEHGEKSFMIMMALLVERLPSQRLVHSLFAHLKLSHGLRDQIMCLSHEHSALRKLKGADLEKKSSYLWIGYRLLTHNLGWVDLLVYTRAIHGISAWSTHVMKQVFTSGALNIQNLQPVVKGEDLIRQGMEPGEHFKSLLDQCLMVQFSEGLTAPIPILEKVLKK